MTTDPRRTAQGGARPATPGYTVTLRDETWREVLAAIFSLPGCEGAAYILCGVSRTSDEVRFLGRRVLPVEPEHYLVREPDALSIDSGSYVSAAKQAAAAGEAIIFVHSHPDGYADFSPQDDREDPKLHTFLADYAPHAVHGSLVVSGPTGPRALGVGPTSLGIEGRVWVGGGWQTMRRLRVLGDEFRFFDRAISVDEELPPFFDRQVRAFGEDIQRLLARLHIGIVGVGGTGSAALEQLTRLGVGTITVFDGDTFDTTNVNRVYGSWAADKGRAKVEIAARNVSRIGVGTSLTPLDEYVDVERAARDLTRCDLLLGCTDDQTSRAILLRVALWYLIPVFDLGVLIDATEDHTIRDVTGRVSLIIPGEACPFCRRSITPEGIAAEALTPEERAARARDGYVPALATRAPAVIPFTTAVAAQAVTELLHRLTGFMGAGSVPSEVLLRFDYRDVSTNRPVPTPGCQCGDRDRWGRGDERQFLRRGWPLASQRRARTTDAG